MADGDFLVVGGGPAGVAAASAIRAAGKPVTIIDAGLRLEPERDAARERLAATLPEQWSAADLASTRFVAAGVGGVGYKRLFGSDLAFRDDGVDPIGFDDDVGARPSYALGGLSNVWGAGMLPYTDVDMAGWPLSAADLERHYRAVLGFVPYSAADDELSARYPVLAEHPRALVRTEGGEAVLRRLRGRAGRLEGAGYTFGGARLAVRVAGTAPEHGCVYCNHCLDGCPYGHIYSSSQTVLDLAARGEVTYLDGLHAVRVEQDANVATVIARRVRGGATERITGRRVLLAAGAVSTTVILQRSGILPPRSTLVDSQTMFLPFAWAGRIGRTGREPGYTLAQAFVVLEDPAVSRGAVHLSLYTYDAGLLERARDLRPRLTQAFGPALGAAMRRLVFGIAFFHSDDSSRVVSVLASPDGTARLEAEPNPGCAATVVRYGRSILRGLGGAGLVPVLPLAKTAPTGGGYHYGGSIPMRRRPGPTECDVHGRPAGRGRIHVVDASCFPTIPGGTITFPAMANAHRIATWAAAQRT